MVLDIHFGHLGALLLCQNRYKAVELPIESHVLRDLSLVHPERAAVVLEVDVCGISNDPVGDFGRDFSKYKSIFSIGSTAGYHIPFLVDCFLEHAWKVGRIILQIPIHGGDVFPCGLINTRC